MSQPTIGGAHRQTGGATKVKVSLGSLGLVIPIGNTNDKVERLLRDISARFEGMGIKPGELRLAELRTSDGFIFSSHDIIRDVITDGETLTAVEFSDWVESQKPLCKDTWLEVVRQDFEDNDYKWIAAGLHEYNKLFVKFGKNWPSGSSAKLIGLELFDPDSLLHFAKDGKVLIGSKEGKTEGGATWKLEAYFNVVKGVAKDIELSVKAGSDAKPIITKVELKIGKKIEKGVETVVQDDKDRYNPSDYKLPAASKTGTSITETNSTKKTTTDAKSTGHPNIQITQCNPMEIDQTWEYDGVFNNLFYINFNILNKSDKTIAITDVIGEIYKDNKWTSEGVTCKTGERYGFMDYRWTNENKNYFTMSEKQQFETAVLVSIPIKAPQFDRLRRAHKSLPQPLKIRYTFIDSEGKKAEVLVEQYNDPLKLVTKQSREERDSKKYDFWMQCDDANMEIRIFQTVNINKEDKRIEFSQGPSNSKYFYVADIKQTAYQAVKEKKTEIEIPDKWTEKDCSATAYGVVDLKNQRMYAIKFELKTTTSTVIDYFLLPILE